MSQRHRRRVALRAVASGGKARAVETLQQLRERPRVGLIYRIFDGTIGDFFRHQALVYAAAVAFYSAISLIPFLLLIASLGGYVVAGRGEFRGDEANALLTDLVAFLRVAVPYLGDNLESSLRDLVALRAQLGLAGAISLLLVSSLVFRSLEFALARVFSWRDVDDVIGKPRNFVVSKALFGAFAMALVMLMLSMRYLLAALHALVARVDMGSAAQLARLFLGEGSALRSLLWALVVVISFVIVLAVFTRRRVRPRLTASLLGGLLFVVLWRAAGWAFDFYIGKLTSLPSTYGPWAAWIIIQLWIYYSAVVFMLASEFAKTIEKIFAENQHHLPR